MATPYCTITFTDINVLRKVQQSVPDQDPPPQQVLRALELADGYLHEAQDVLWRTALDSPATAERQQLENLTEQIWTVQHQLSELQQQFEQ